MSRGSRRSRRAERPRRTWPQRLLICLNLLVALACLGTALALRQVKAIVASVPYVSVGFSLAPPVRADEPRNVLLIGTDSAARLDPSDPVKNGRDDFGLLADVIMILRIDPSSNSASLLSIPRDTWVPTAPFDKKEKINAAINGNRGAENLIATIKENFGISIQNFAQVDFRGFRDLVSVLGGVPVYLNMPIRDRNTGLYQEQLGCVTLDPVQALAYARSRHFEYFDGKRWRSDPTSDLGRITRQQDFLRSAAQRAANKGIRNPATAFNLVDAAANAVTLDSTLSVGQILDVLDLFRSFNVDSLQTFQIPTVGVKRGLADTLDVRWSEAIPILRPFWGVPEGGSVEPRNVLVEVASGGDVASFAQSLESVGFDADAPSTSAAKSKSRSDTTVISRGPNGADAARLLARYFDGPVRIVADKSLPGYRVRVDVGRDVEDVRSEPLDDSSLDVTETTSRGDRTTTTSSTPARPTTTAPSSTTSVATGDDGVEPAPPGEPGVVPVDPQLAASCT